MKNRTSGSKIPSTHHIVKNLNNMLPFTGAQRCLFLLENHSRTVNSHTIAYEIKGKIDLSILKLSIVNLFRRHPILRARVAKFQKEMFEIVTPENYFQQFNPLLCHNDPNLLSVNYEKFDFKSKYQIGVGFNIYNGPLSKCHFIQFKQDHGLFVWDFHHLIIDRVSIKILIQELSEFYNGSLNKEFALELPAFEISDLNPIPFHEDEKINRAKYFKKKLENITSLSLEADGLKHDFRFKGERHYFNFDGQISANYLQIPNASLNQFLTSTFYILLYYLTSFTQDICVGIPSANRKSGDDNLESIVNCLFGIVPLRLQISPELTFLEFLAIVKEELKESLKNQLPMDEYTQALSRENRKSLGIPVPYKVVLMVSNDIEKLNLEHIQSSPQIEIYNGSSQFENFAVHIWQDEQQLFKGYVEYNPNTFTKNNIQLIVKRWEHIIAQAIHNPSLPIKDYSYLLQEECEQINQFNHTARQPIYHGYLPEIMEELASHFADKIAIKYQPFDSSLRTLTYANYYFSAVRLANHLHELGIRMGDKIGYSLEYSTETEIVKLAIILSGAITVPLDVVTKPQVIANKILFFNLQFCFVDNTTKSLFENSTNDLQIFNINDETFFDFSIHNKCELKYKPELHDESLSHLYCTSGTTKGHLKAAMVTHGGLKNLLNYLGNLDANTSQNILSTGAPTSDSVLYDLFLALTHGSFVYLVAYRYRMSFQVIDKILDTEQIDTYVLTPEIASQLSADCNVNKLLVMGSSASSKLLRELKENVIPHGIVSCGYGLTECTVVSTDKNSVDPNHPTLIGKPIDNTEIHIVAKDGDSLRLVGPNVSGELLVSGPSVMAGYYENTELTNKKLERLELRDGTLIPSETGKIYCHTGDYGSYIENHYGGLEIKYIGRQPHEGKFHQFNLDLAELKDVFMTEHPHIKDAIVLPTPNNSGIIVGFILDLLSTDLDKVVKDLRNILKTKYAFPTIALPRRCAAVALDFIPTSSHGKANVDYDYLAQKLTPSEDAMLPSTMTQQLLQDLWIEAIKNDDEILPQDFLGTQVTFEEIGGDSLSLARFERIFNRQWGKIFSHNFFLDLKLDRNKYISSEDLERHATRGPITFLDFIHRLEVENKNLKNLLEFIQISSEMTIESLEKNIKELENHIIFNYISLNDQSDLSSPISSDRHSPQLR